MKIEDIFGFVQDELMTHWIFLVVSLVLGIFGSFMKTRVWTKERAKYSKPKWFWWWGRATLPLHAAVEGILIGIIFKSFDLAGPGIETTGQYIIYYIGSGIVSSWVYSGFKHFLKSRGVDGEEIEKIDMPSNNTSVIKENSENELGENDKDTLPPTVQ